MSEITVNGSTLNNRLMGLLSAKDIEPGDQAGYELCKAIWEYHPLGGKLVEKPVRLALSKGRIITVDAQPKDMLVEAYQREWEKLGATNHIRDVMFINRTYGAAAIVVGADRIPTTDPIDPWLLPDLNIYFNQLDPLNLAGSIVTNQNPNAPDFQKPLAYATAAGQPYHPSRSCVVFNGTPIYLSYQSSGFGYTGRSVFQRALYPLKSFIQSMVTDDLVTFKAGLLIAKQKPAGSIVNRLMQTAAGIKREYLQQGATGNILSIDIDETIEALNLSNTDTAMGKARDNIIANIAAASDVPAILLKDEAFTQGFGEGTEDAKAIVQYVNGIRDDMASLFAFFDKIVMHRAWNKEFYEAVKAAHPEIYKSMSYEQAFYTWQNGFSADWESLMEEPESEKVKVADTKLKGITEILRTIVPSVDPQNRALMIQWAQDNLNEMPEMFASNLQLDIDAISEYEPPEAAMPEQKMPRPDAYFARGDQANPVPKADDGEHWITLHGGEGEGEHVMINGEGKIMAGAGGNLNGKTLSNVKSMSGNVEKHGAPAPAFPPKPSEPTEAPKPVEPPAAPVEPPKPVEPKPVEPKAAPIEPPAVAAARQKTEEARTYLKQEGIAAKVKFEKENKTTSVIVPKYEDNFSEADQKKIQQWAIDNGYTYVQSTPINPNEFQEGRKQYNFYHNPTTQKPYEAPKPVEPAEPKQEWENIREKWEKERAKQLEDSEKALEMSIGAKTKDEHMESMASNLASYRYWKGKDSTRANGHAAAYNKHLKAVKAFDKAEVKKNKPAEEKEKESKFTTHEAHEVDAHLKERYGLGFENGSTAEKDAKDSWKKYIEARRKNDPDADKYKDEYNSFIAAARAIPSYRLSGHTSYDIHKAGVGAKNVRKALGHVDSAMASLEASGFDIKAAMAKGNVKFAAGTTGKSNGHAWQHKGVGYFSISTTKRIGNDPDQERLAQLRQMRGEPRWSISSTAKDQARATIVHELAHALGMQDSVKSPERLAQVLAEEFGREPGSHAKIRDFIKNNISEYATTNIKETDAELAAMVTDPDYVRGTLPKRLEDHVDWLFNRKQ